MSDFLRSYLTVAVFGVFAVVLVTAILAVSGVLRPRRDTPQKLMTYESGVDALGDMWMQTNIRYYVFALLFVVFDVEVVFLFPWATRMEVYGTPGLVKMGIFIFILALGLLHTWRKGLLRWL